MCPGPAVWDARPAQLWADVRGHAGISGGDAGAVDLSGFRDCVRFTAARADETICTLLDLLQEVVYEYGKLVQISGGCDEVLVPQRPVVFDQVVLTFEHGVITVVAQGDDDTVEVRQGLGTAPYGYVLTDSDPLNRFVGRGAQWVWLLRNQQGYEDGFQIEFESAGDCRAIQMICEASTLRIAVLSDPNLSVAL